MRPVTMQADQLKPFAVFLEEHPGFSPLLMGEDALVYGFQVGDCHLQIDEMERLIATHPRYDARQAALLLSAPSNRGQR
jgi:hypothetical protein